MAGAPPPPSAAGGKAALGARELESSIFPRAEVDDPLYFDYNATTPIDPAVADAMIPFMRAHWGNPSSGYVFGRRAKAAVQKARAQVASLLRAAKPDEVVFTSGGTESINWSLKGMVLAHQKARAPDAAPVHVISSRVEHPAVLNTLRWLEVERGVEVTRVGVAPDGTVRVDDVVDAVIPGRTVLVTLMQGNNETGALTDIAGVVKAVKENFPEEPIAFHSDSSQCLGKVPVCVDELGVDLLTVAAHKVYGPKGIGALYIRDGLSPPLAPFMEGGGQEGGRRNGTENVVLSVALGEACEIAERTLDSSMEKAAAHRAQLLDELTKKCNTTPTPNGPSDHSQHLPNTLSVGFPGVTAPELLAAITNRVACSAGAACHTDSSDAEMSHVLREMGVAREVGVGTLRLSVGRWTTEADIGEASDVIAAAVNALLEGKDAPAAVGAIPRRAGMPGGSGGATGGAGGGMSSTFELPVPATKPLYTTDTYRWTGRARVLRTAAAGDLPEGWAQGGWPHVVFTSHTVFHPQGGGQPSDRGIMLLQESSDVPDGWEDIEENTNGSAPAAEADTAALPTPRASAVAGVVVFEVGLVKPAPDRSGAVCHYGRFRRLSEAEELNPDAVPSRADKLLGGSDGGAAFAEGTVVLQLVSGKLRRTFARLHSAGHLLDSAMTNIGFPLPAGKGYHFLDGPFVEYLGVVDVEARATLAATLQAECDRLIAENSATEVASAKKGSSKLEELGVSPDYVSFLPDDADIRVVRVGGVVGCPCGGTHVRRAGEIGKLKIGKVNAKKGKTKVKYSVEDLDLEGVAA